MKGQLVLKARKDGKFELSGSLTLQRQIDIQRQDELFGIFRGGKVVPKSLTTIVEIN